MPPATRAPRLPDRDAPARGADVTRDKLLQATHELLFEHTGSEPSVSEICTRAGVNVAMVSYCFGGKDRLLVALVERTTASVIAELQRLAALDLSPEDKLRRHIAGIVRNYVRYPYVNQLGERLQRRQDAAAAALTERFALPTLGFYRDLVAEGDRQGAFRATDPTLLFFSVIGMCEFVFTARSWLEGAFSQPVDDAFIERFVAHTADVVLHGIAA
jgi:TetR/AcrR family transcriptional regulator